LPLKLLVSTTRCACLTVAGIQALVNNRITGLAWKSSEAAAPLSQILCLRDVDGEAPGGGVE